MTQQQRILINRSKEQLRVARVDGQMLYDLEIEQAESHRKIDRICNGEVKSIEPSLNAAFISYGSDSDRNGFLPLKEVSPSYYPERLRDQIGRVNIKDVLFVGQKVLVQIVKEERDQKGAALTTYISLAGCYLVLMPNNPKAGGISRRIEGDERDDLKSLLRALKIPQTMGVIIRTAGMGKAVEELQWDLDVLVQLWDAIQEASKSHGAPYLIHQESDVAIRAVRDHLRPEISEILIDDKEIYEQVLAYIEKARPAFVSRVKLYEDPVPLFSRYQIEKQIETAFQRKVRLPSGGEIVIDRTEALISIDVNSARSTKGADIEQTATSTNIEAAQEIARQLRIRDLGGLIVLDLIDMEYEQNRHKVEDALRDALRNDRARVQIGHISRFGLLEMSRQRLRSALNEEMLVTCPRCHGQGSIRNTRSEAIAIVHLLEETAAKKSASEIRAQVPIDVAAYLMNELRDSFDRIQKTHGVEVLIIPNPYIESPQFNIETVAKSSGGDKGVQAIKPASYKLIATPKISFEKESEPRVVAESAPAVKGVLPETAAPIISKQTKPAVKKEGLLKRLISAVFGSKKKTVKAKNHRERRPDFQRTQKPYRKEPRRTDAGGGNRPPSNRPVSRDSRDPRDSRERPQGSGSAGGGYNNRRRPAAPPRQGSSRPQQQTERTASARPSQGFVPKAAAPVSKPAPMARPEPIVKVEQPIKPEVVKAVPMQTETKPVFTPKPVENRGGFVQIETAEFKPVFDQVRKEQPKRSSEPASWEKKSEKPAADKEFVMIETKKE